jgi:hypothetical protein
VHDLIPLGKIDFAKQFCQGVPIMQRFSSIFSQLLQLFPLIEFEKCRQKAQIRLLGEGIFKLGEIRSHCFVSSAAPTAFVRFAAGWPVAKES